MVYLSFLSDPRPRHSQRGSRTLARPSFKQTRLAPAARWRRLATLIFATAVAWVPAQAIAQTTVVEDSFRGSGNLDNRVPDTKARDGGKWNVETGNPVLDGSAFVRANNSMRAVIQTGVADGSVETTVDLDTYNSGLLLRSSDSENYFRFAITGSGWTLVRTKGGDMSTLASGGGSYNDGATHRLTAVLSGPLLTLAINGKTVGSVSSTFNQKATKHGLFASGSGARAWDHFKVTTGTAASEPEPTPTPQPAPAPAPEKEESEQAPATTGNRLAVYLTTDIDVGNETDDEAALAMFLGSQDMFNIVGLDASIPDGRLTGYTQMFDEYQTDLAKLRSYTSNPSQFKSVDQLKAVLQQGVHKQDSTPTKGYRVSGDSSYAEAHAAAAKLIAAARTYGDPNSSDPKKKLWIVMMGAWNTLAQALYETSDPDGPQRLPDFLDRVRVICTSAQNASRDDNSQDYILANTHNSSGKKLKFGDLRLMQVVGMHGRLNDQSSESKRWWREEVKDRGAMGKFLAKLVYPGFSDPGSDGKAQYFRWSDGLNWVWLRHAYRTNNFDPTAANVGGKFRTYVRERWSDANEERNGFQFPGSLSGFPTRGYVYSPYLYSDAPGGKENVNLAAAQRMAQEIMDRYEASKGN